MGLKGITGMHETDENTEAVVTSTKFQKNCTSLPAVTTVTMQQQQQTKRRVTNNELATAAAS